MKRLIIAALSLLTVSHPLMGKEYFIKKTSTILKDLGLVFKKFFRGKNLVSKRNLMPPTFTISQARTRLILINSMVFQIA
jgi:hypothetical protein